MIKLHKLYFFFWKLYMRANGIKIGTFFLTYSDDKYKNIKGVVTSLSGDSISKSDFEFTINIQWLEPIEGYDNRYFICGSYSYKEVQNKLRQLK